uniref:Uncharacterized protein n=1 Tax=Panagrolaimus superbus TaxID=310955 RepID=A0A914YQV6_9BILA
MVEKYDTDLYNILCTKDVDIFNHNEKQEKVIFEYDKTGSSDDKEEQLCNIMITDRHLNVRPHGDNKAILESLHFSQRVIHGKNYIIFFASDSVNYRKTVRILKFQTEKTAEKLIKIIWKHKNKEAGFNPSNAIIFKNKEASFCPISETPPLTITHSTHDLAAVFSYEEKQASIKVWTSKNSATKYPCRIHIDVEKESILIKSIDSDSFEISFSQRQSRNYDTLTFAMKNSNDNEKYKLTFNDKQTGEKVDKIMENVKARKKAIKAEKLTLDIMLQKLVQEPSSIKNIKKILKYYATSFTIFKEEYRRIALEVYRSYNFHDTIFPSTSHPIVVMPQIVIKQEISEFESPAKKIKYDEDAVDVNVPMIKIKKMDDANTIRYPNFEFLCNDKGVPKKTLIIFASADKELRYEFAPTYRPDYDTVLYSCTICDKLRPSNHVTAKYCVNEFGETFIKINGKHICKPRTFPKIKEHKHTVFERHLYKGYKEAAFPKNSIAVPRKMTHQWSKILMIYTPSKNAYYHYKEFSMNGLYYCCECKEKDKYVFAKCVKLERNKDTFEIMDEDHICTPKECKLPELIAESYNDEDSDDD